MLTKIRNRRCFDSLFVFAGLLLGVNATAQDDPPADEFPAAFAPTHIVPAKSEYYAKLPRKGEPSEGRLAANTPVMLLGEEGRYTRVRFRQGLVGYVAYEVLVPIVGRDDVLSTFRSILPSADVMSVDLYRELSKEPGNLVFSPTGICTSLAIAYAGAAGDTEKEMASVLHLEGLERSRYPFSSAYRGLLNSSNERGGYIFRSANRLWGPRIHSYKIDFLRSMRSRHGANFRTADFTAGEATRRTIDKWVDFQTLGQIDSLIPMGALNQDTQLVLTDASCFQGAWELPFSPETTADAEFQLLSGERIKTPTMHQTEFFRYADFDGGQFLQLPYVGGEVVMIVLLPKERGGLTELERSLDSSALRRWIDAARPRDVKVSLPKFALTSHLDLMKPLQSLGMNKAFGKDADFSRMATDKSLRISQVLHKSHVEVSEQSVEADPPPRPPLEPFAAPIRREPLEFRADHPFLFLIWDFRMGAPTFLGRIVDPRGD